MNVQGVVAESIISFKITWVNSGTGQNKFDQNDQVIEMHTTDIYPDLLYTSAYGAPKYLKYTSGPLLNELFNAVNAIVDLKLGATNEAAALPPGPEKPKGLPPGPQPNKSLAAGSEPSKGLPPGPEPGKAIASGPKYDLVRADTPLSPATITNNQEEPNDPDVKPNEPETKSNGNYRVTVYGNKLRFLEAQEERGAYSGGIKFIYKVSNNLIKSIAGDNINNSDKIWAEISFDAKPTIRMEFKDFNQSDLKFGGNLLVQVFPSIELSFTPDQNSVYAREAPEIDFADILKSTKITLGGKTNDEILAIQKEIQNELEVRKTNQNTPGKQSAPVENK